jgi:TonB family protein
MLHWNEAAGMAFLLNLAVKSTALLAAAWLAAFALRRQSAAARHMVWMAAFAAALALPVLSVALPALELRAPAWLPDASSIVFGANANATSDRVAAVAATPAAASPAPARNSNAPLGSNLDWRLWVMLLWCGGSAVLLAQMIAAYIRMARQRRRACVFGASFDLPTGVQAVEAPAGSMPMTFGVLHPVVFLPSDAMEWSEERRAMVVRHELAHIERGDAAMHLAARAALSLLWWNPLAWKAWREFLKERERAADDLVLAGGARASDYAGHLLEIARSMQSEPATAWAAVAMARRSQLEGRLLSILDSRVSRNSARRASAIAVAAAAIALCAPFAAVRAQSSQTPLPADVEATIRAAAAQKNHEILDNAAAAFEKLRNFDTAKQLLNSSLEIRGSVAGEQSAEYAAGLVKLGDLEAKRSRPNEALAFYQKAVGLGDRAEVAPALIYLGVHSVEGKDYLGAMGFFQRAAAVSNSASNTGKAYMWMAMVESSDPDHAAEAEADFRKSIATLDANSSELATSLNLFAWFLSKHDRGSEAEPLQKQATAIIQKLEASNTDASEVASKFVLRAGGDVSRPQLIKKVEPAYTEEARAAKYQGVVVLYVVIEPDGTADSFRVVKSLGLGLDEKAIEAVQQWQFKPGIKNGAAVPVAATIEVNFKLL